MALNTKISTSARNAAANAIAALVDGGASAGYIEIRTGAPPTNPGDADSGTLLATCPMSDPAFGSASFGVATANSITSDSAADASGTAGHFRVKDSNGNVIFQGTAGETADTPNMVFDDSAIVAGGTVAISSLTITQPAAGS